MCCLAFDDFPQQLNGRALINTATMRTPLAVWPEHYKTDGFVPVMRSVGPFDPVGRLPPDDLLDPIKPADARTAQLTPAP